MALRLLGSGASGLDAGVHALLARILDKATAVIWRDLYVVKHNEHLPFEQSMALTEGQIGLFALTPLKVSWHFVKSGHRNGADDETRQNSTHRRGLWLLG